MSYDGSGTYSLTYNFQSEAGSPPIAISKLDTEFSGIATALSSVILRNGTGKPTADIDWNAKKITNLADATAATDALNRQAADARYAQLGGATFTGALNGTAATFSTTLDVTGAVTFSATLAVTGNLTVNTNKFTVDASTGNTVVAGTINVTGAATLSSTLGVTGAVTLSSTLAVTGALTASGNIELGHASDTTLSRLAAGRIAVEGVEIGYRQVPRSTTTTTAAVGDVGKCIAVSAGITIPNATFAAGDALSIYNDSASAITITQGASFTLRQAGTSNTGNRTLAARGLATVWFNTASEGVISGAGVS